MTRTFWAPGRVNLIGEYTDLVGGLVLPAALDLGVRLEAVPAETIELRSRELEGVARVAADGSPANGEPTGWTRYPAAVAAELALLGRPAVGIAGDVSSTLPIGTGLSSSAALEIGVALALCAVAEFELAPLELALAAQRAEHRAVGVPSGVMDQAASLLGRADHALLLDTGTLAYEHVPLPPELVLVIVHSGVSRLLEESGYAMRRAELERAVAGADDPVSQRRLRHVVTENERVREAVRLLRDPSSRNLERLGEVFRAGHESLRRDLEVSTLELDLLVELAYEHGAVGARMTGGGFGGSILALARADEAHALADAVLRDYAAGSVSVCHASDGAREIS